MLSLRGHHLICLHFFSGEGYDDNFLRNLKAVLKRAVIEEIRVCEGADAICEECSYLINYECRHDEHADEEIKDMDMTALRLLEKDNGAIVTWQRIRQDIPRIFSHWYSAYCDKCDWKQACDKDQFYNELKR